MWNKNSGGLILETAKSTGSLLLKSKLLLLVNRKAIQGFGVMFP